MSSSLMLRYWSTLFSVPRIEMSFLSSTVTSADRVLVSETWYMVTTAWRQIWRRTGVDERLEETVS